MICLEDVKGMIAEHVGKYGKHPSKMSITAHDYDIIRYQCMMRTKMDCATAEDVKDGTVIARLCGLAVSIGDETRVM